MKEKNSWGAGQKEDYPTVGPLKEKHLSSKVCLFVVGTRSVKLLEAERSWREGVPDSEQRVCVAAHQSTLLKTHFAMRVMLSFLSGMWGTADVEIKVPSAENPEPPNFCPWSRSEHNPGVIMGFPTASLGNVARLACCGSSTFDSKSGCLSFWLEFT